VCVCVCVCVYMHVHCMHMCMFEAITVVEGVSWHQYFVTVLRNAVPYLDDWVVISSCHWNYTLPLLH